MTKRLIAALILALGLLLLAALAQFRPAELSEARAWEGFLTAAKIVESNPIGGLEASGSSWMLTLEKDGVRRSGLWRSIDTDGNGASNRWRYEIAAYRLDRLLGLAMVPPTVERSFNGGKGSLQLWVDDSASLKTKTQIGQAIPADRQAEWNRAVCLERAFDSLIADSNRGPDDILVTGDWRMILADHSRSFPSDGRLADHLVFGSTGLTRAADGGAQSFLPLPRSFVERLKKLDYRTVKSAVMPYLTDREIRAVIVRAKLILREIEDGVRQNGEAAVIYR